MNQINKTIFSILIELILILSSQKINAQYPELYIPDIPRNINIEFSKKQYEKFQTDIKEISGSSIANITPKNKNKYKASISFDLDGKTQKCEAETRINGDWKDHIDLNKHIASLRINLLDCHIGGINKFRLLLLQTKSYTSEIFWSMLMNYYGFPTLYTQFVVANVNGTPHNFIFQERPSTIFLERHGIRESPIVEHDERQLWLTRSSGFDLENSQKIEFTNSSMPLGLRIQKALGIDAATKRMSVSSEFGRIDNQEFLKDDLKIHIAMIALSEYRARSVINADFYNKVNQKYGSHGLIPENRKFIYLPITNSFLPLYYDGNLNFNFDELHNKQIDLTVSQKDGCIIDPEKKPSNNFIAEYRKRSGLEPTKEMYCAYQDVANYEHLINWSLESAFTFGPTTFYSSNLIERKIPKVKNNLTGFDSPKYLSYLISENQKFFVCDPNTRPEVSCTIANEAVAKSALTGKLTSKTSNGEILVIPAAGETKEKISAKSFIISDPGKRIVEISQNEKAYIFLPDSDNRVINVNLNGSGARVIFTGTVNKHDRIEISGHAPTMYPNMRHDQVSLTGCATFYHLQFNGGSIVSSATGCEDSINILSSNGKINYVGITSSSEDALDMDYSNIEIDQIEVNNAGNDCLDLSTGSYQLSQATLNNCGDKGVSAGEYANVEIGITVINKSLFGLVSKDGSYISVDKFYGSNIKDKCIATYVKKRRFPNGRVIALETSCQEVKK